VSALVPTDAQREVLEEPSLSALVLAPAGCGKTEALALRVEGILARHQSVLPQQVLVVTFSNKARDNIQERIVDRIGLARTRSLVTVQNLHGLSGRIYVAHSYVLGLDPLATLPDDKWLPARLKAKTGNAADRKAVAEQLRAVKQQRLDDEQVLEYLDSHGQKVAAVIERERQADNRLTYDDLPRLAEVILQNPNIAAFYQNHFSAVIVDEFQDLTPQQLRIIQAIGAGKTTYAGDLAQGIYSFTGADPHAVLAAIRSEGVREIAFSESHRSSPKVLEAVNSLSPWTGGQTLTCARPDQWPDGGAGAVQGFIDLPSEATWIVESARKLLDRFPTHRIGIIARLNDRLEQIDVEAAASGLSVHRWKDPLYNLFVSRQLKVVLARVDETAFKNAPDKPKYLWELTDPLEHQDLETLAQMQESYEWASDLAVSGTPIRDISVRVKTGDADALLRAPGLHLLTAHTGKGQQFDWVFAAGLEQGVLPFELAMKSQSQLDEELRIFSVMLSRARFGVVITYSAQIMKWGNVQAASPSKFLGPVSKVSGLLDGAGFIQRLNDGTFG
jgi:DNA helicase II / ATP-dependent DNA helicase PcrA